MKSCRIFLRVKILLLAGLFSGAPLCARAAAYGADEPGEVGDLLYRSSLDGKMYGINSSNYTDLDSGHVGIYIGLSNSSANGFVSAVPRVIEALGWNPFGVTGVFYDVYDKTTHADGYFLSNATYVFMGAKTVGAATSQQRRNIVLLAYDQIGEGYDETFMQQKGPGTDDWICTGLAEKVYESANLNGTVYAGDTLPLQYTSSQYAIDLVPDGVHTGAAPATAFEKSDFIGPIDIYMPVTQMLNSDKLSYSSPVNPVTAAAFSPASPNGSNGWYTSNVSVSLTASDGNYGSGIYGVFYQVGAAGWLAYSSPYTVTSTDYVYSMAQDNAGNFPGSVSPDAYLKIDKAAPTGSVSVDNGAAYANSASVTLALSAADADSGVSEMRFSNDGSSWSGWEAYSASKAWTLTAGAGNRTVYAQFRDNAGWTSVSYSDSISLDSQGPAGSVSVNGGDAYSASASVTLTLSASDSAGTVTQMRFSNDGSSWGSWEAYSASKAWTLAAVDGNKTVYVQFKDNAGNLSDTCSDSIGLDTQGPSGSVAINSGDAYVNSAAVTLTLSASDTGSGVSLMCFSNDGASWSAWEAYAGSKAWTLAAGDGDRTVYVKYKDNSGPPNTATVSDTIVADLTPPLGPVVTSPSHTVDVWTVSNDPQFSWSASGAVSGVAGYSYELDHAASFTPDTIAEPAGTSKIYTDIADGVWYFHVRARDNAGNWGEGADFGPIKIDLAAPTFGQIAFSRVPAKEGRVDITIVSSEQLSLATAAVAQSGQAVPTAVALVSADSVTWTGSYNVAPGYDGAAVLGVSGLDLAGRYGSGGAGFVVDTIKPGSTVITSLTHPGNSYVSSRDPVFSWNAVPDASGSGLAGYSYLVSQNATAVIDGSTETFSLSPGPAVQLAGHPDGTWWLHLAAVDNAGNIGDAASYKFIIDTSSPVLTAAASSDPCKAGTIAIAINSDETLQGTPTVNVRQNGQGAPTSVAVSPTGEKTWQGTYTVVGGFDGTASIAVTGGDLAGNTTMQASAFQVDTVGPSASVAFTPAAPLRSGAFIVTVTLQDASSVPLAPLLSFTLSNGATMTIALTGSDKNWQGAGFIYSAVSTGSASVSFSAADAAGNAGTAITGGGTFAVDTSINGNAGGGVYNNDGAAVVAPPNIYPGPMNVVIVTPDPLLPEIILANSNSGEVISVGALNLHRDFSAKDSNTEAPLTNFSLPVTIKIPYPDANNDGIVDGTNILETRLSIYWLNEAASKWEQIAQTTPDYAQNIFSAAVYHFSVYSLLANGASNLNSVRVYPVPWTPGSGDRYDSPSPGCGEGLQIDNLTSDAKISIYNLPGDLVRKLKVGPADNGCKAWDGKNEAGRKVASGVYLAVIEGAFGKKTVKKLVLER